MVKINGDVSVGNILATVSILVGIGTFVYTEHQRREQVDRAFSAEIRSELGRGLQEAALLDSELKLMFLSIEPLYVATSERALDETNPEGRVERARDYLWQEISVSRARMERHVLETIAANTGMARAGNEVQSRFAEFRQEHASIRLQAFAALSKATQEALQSSAREARFSAEIGNALRAAHYKVEADYLSASSKARDGISAFLRSFGAQ